MNAVLLIFVGLLASVGLGYLLWIVQRWLLRPRGRLPLAVVVPVFGAQEDIELVLRAICARLLPEAPGSALVIADFGADAATIQICRLFCGCCSGVRICRGEDLPIVLRASVSGE